MFLIHTRRFIHSEVWLRIYSPGPFDLRSCFLPACVLVAHNLFEKWSGTRAGDTLNGFWNVHIALKPHGTNVPAVMRESAHKKRKENWRILQSKMGALHGATNPGVKHNLINSDQAARKGKIKQRSQKKY